jgi:alkylhydroperoxidase/carboxymuconolactone decarboxylase family protein YurZ
MPGLDPHRQKLKDAFVAARGYWSELWDGVLELSPEFFEAYSALSSVPWKHGTLQPKLKELIYVAVDASTTHLYNPGTRIHIANALKHGATRDEVMEVLEIVSVLGIHTMSTGLPILIEELRIAGRGGEVKEGALSPEQEKLKQDFVQLRLLEPGLGTAAAALARVLRCVYAAVLRPLEAWHARAEVPGTDLHCDRRRDDASVFARAPDACPQRARSWCDGGGDHGGAAAHQHHRHPHCDGRRADSA